MLTIRTKRSIQATLGAVEKRTFVIASSQSKEHNLESGFTLVEVAIAIALLGLGLMTLTALSVRLMNDTQEEANRIRASFFAQYILEVNLADKLSGANNQNDSELSNNSSSLYSKLQAIDYFNGLENQAEFEYLKEWNSDFNVENITLPFTTTSLDKFRLTVNWGPGANQEFTLETIKKAKDTNQNSGSPNAQSGNGSQAGDDDE